MAIDVTKLDLYELLDVPPEASLKEIGKAYRKAALKCHPDKNRDDVEAGQKFILLQQAAQILLDEAARAKYDSVLKAKQAAAERTRVLDSKRKKLKEDLEAREKASESSVQSVGRAARNLEEEIKRLRKEGCRLLEQEQELMREQLRQEQQQAAAAAAATKSEASVSSGSQSRDSADAPCLFVKWKDECRPDLAASGSGHTSADAGTTISGYDESSLRSLFTRYGKVADIHLYMKSKKTYRIGSALIEFEPASGSNMAAAALETGLPGRPLEAKWHRGTPSTAGASTEFENRRSPVYPSSPSHEAFAGRATSPEHAPTLAGSKRTAEATAHAASSGGVGGLLDYESLVLRRLRQAEERRRLIEQMQADDTAACSTQEKR